ncbi:hypothetical protein ABK046_34970 [Streptomyces caeruleatus]
MPKVPRSVWREHVKTRVAVLRIQLDQIKGQSQGLRVDTLKSISNLLEEAEKAANSGRAIGRKSYLIEQAWSNIRAAEVSMFQHLPLDDVVSKSPEVLAKAERHLSKADPRVEELKSRIQYIKAGRIGPSDHQFLTGILDASYEAEDAEVARVRSLRNILWLTTLLFSAGVAAFLAYMCFNPQDLSLCFKNEPSKLVACPSKEYLFKSEAAVKSVSAGAKANKSDALAIAIAGLAGAALTSVAALRRIAGTSSPYSLPIAAAALKFPTGAVTAILGILLIHGGFLPGLSALDTRAQLLAWAVIFGAAQQLVTRLVDDRARRVMLQAGRSGAPSSTNLTE